MDKSGWQPIDTAPKDGTPVWIYGYSMQGHLARGGPYKYWRATVGERVDEHGVAYYDKLRPGSEIIRGDIVEVATHWMPLPAPPTSK